MLRRREFRMGRNRQGNHALLYAGRSAHLRRLHAHPISSTTSCHNIAKLERYEIEGRKRQVLVHRKGAHSRLSAGTSLKIPAAYRAVGLAGVRPGQHGYCLMGIGRQRGRDARDIRQRLLDGAVTAAESATAVKKGRDARQEQQKIGIAGLLVRKRVAHDGSSKNFLRHIRTSTK
jgi:hypothetical protein